MLTLAIPAFSLHLTGGDNRGVPLTTESTRGLHVLETTLGAGALAPHQIVVDTHRPGGAYSAPVVAAQRRLVAELRRDPAIEAQTIAAPAFVNRALARQANLVDADGRVLQIRAAGRTDSGTQQAMDTVTRLRERYVPAAGFPAGTEVLVSGAPAFGVDFIDKAYGAFPWLVLAVLVISYLILLRAFRSVVLPAKAVVMNLLSVGATYGVLVLAFEHGWGSGARAGRDAPDRRLDPDLPLRAALRPVDGLRGVPALADPRGVGPPPRQRGRRSPTASSTRGGSSRPRRSS